MTGWDSPRGKVSPEFLDMLRAAVGEIVPGDAAWTWLRWQGYGNCAPEATLLTVGDRQYCEQTAGQEELWASVEALGMPDFMWCSTQTFAWGAPLYPDFGIMCISVEQYVKHFVSRGFESFNVPRDAPLPDNTGD